MATTGTTNYSRTILILGRGGTKLTRRYLEKRVKDLSPVGHELSIDEFLLIHKTGILEKPTGKNNKKFFFPTPPTKTDLAKWDLCMFCFILTETCDLSTTLGMYVKKLQKLRNKLCHMNDASLEESRYEEYMEKIDCCFKKCLDEINDADFSKEMDDLVKSFRHGSLALDDTVRFMHTFYKTDTEQKQILEKHSKDHEELDNKFDKMMLKLESIDSRMQEGSSVDIPAVPIVIEVKNCTDDKEAEVLEFLVKRLNELINKKESGLEEDIPNGVLHKIREILQQTLKDLFVQGRHIIKVEQKCILLQIKCTSLASLISLLRDYRSGQLTRQLHGLQMAIRLFSGCKDAELDTIIYQDTFWKVMDELVVNLEERVQRQQNALHPVRSHMALNNGRSLTDLNGSRINGLGDARYAVNTLPDNRTGESNSVRIYVQTATHSDQEQLKEYFETGVIDQGMKLLQEEIGQQLHISNVSITARLVQGGFEKNDERQIDLPNLPQEHTTWGNVDGSNPAEEIDSAAYLQHERVQDISRSDENFENQCIPKGSESSQGHDAVLKVERDLTQQIEQLIDDSYNALASNTTTDARKNVLQAKESVDILFKSHSRSVRDQTLSDLYEDCAFILNQVGECMKATRCYYRAIIFDNHWNRGRHFFMSDMLWGLCLYGQVPGNKNLVSLLTDVEESAIFAERIEKWPVCVAIDEDLDKVYFYLRHFMGASDSMKLPETREPSLRRMARCYHKMGLHIFARQYCMKILKDTCDYDDTEALEIWARSLFETEDYELAFDKCQLALKYCKGTDVTRIQKFRSEIESKMKKADTDKTGPADIEWLKGTNVGTMDTVMKEPTEEKVKKRHKRPKAKNRSENAVQFVQAQQKEKLESDAIVRDKSGPEDKMKVYQEEGMSVRTRNSSFCSISTIETDISALGSETLINNSSSDTDLDDNWDDDCSVTSQTESSDTSNIPEFDHEEEEMQEHLSFYEQSYKLHIENDQSAYLKEVTKNENLLKTGIFLNEAYLDKFVTDKHPDVRSRDEFYSSDYSKEQLLQNLNQYPRKYVKCVIHIERPHEALCRPIASSINGISVIEITGRSKIGQAFNDDVVVVELLDDKLSKDKRYGKVVGILDRQRHKDVKHPVFVCTLDDMDIHLMKPVCKTVPKIHVLDREISKTYKTAKERLYKIEVYDYDEDGGILRNPRILHIDPAKRDSYICLVAFINWGPRHVYPRGAILKLLPPGNDVSSGLNILNLKYEVPRLYDRGTVEMVAKIVDGEGNEPAEHHLCGRTDLTKMNIFTVGKADSELSYAFSVERLDTGYKVGVHIADVATYIPKDSSIDKEAKRRSTTFNPQMRKPRNMIPEPLSSKLCLQPDKRRLTISIFLNVEENGLLMQMDGNNYKIEKSYIKCKRHFTEDEALSITKDLARKNDDHAKDIKNLFRVATLFRSRRLGNAKYSLGLKETQHDTIKPKDIVKECLIVANKKVAERILRSYRQTVPIYYRPAPAKASVEGFLKKYNPYIDSVLRLQDKQIGPKKPKIGDCRTSSEAIFLSKVVWDAMVTSPAAASQYIRKDELHPMQRTVWSSWCSIQNDRKFKRSGSLNETDDVKHTSFANFTSPLDNYSDLIMQRFIHAAVFQMKGCSYTKEEIDNICHHMNSAVKRARNYQRECIVLQKATKLKEGHVLINCCVEDFSDKGLTLCSPILADVATANKELAFNLLNLSAKPLIFEDQVTKMESVKTVWRKRLYDFDVHVINPSDKGQELQLNPHEGVVSLPLHKWAKLLQLMVDGDGDRLSRAIKNTNVSQHEGLRDVSTECFKTLDIQPHTTFSMTYSLGKQVNIQFSPAFHCGILTPKPMLYDMTNNVKFCLQHTRDPVLHLCKYATSATYDRYESVRDYLYRWIPILLMESATGVCRNEESCNISNVPVKLSKKCFRKGTFTLSLAHCEIRNIEFSGIISDDDVDADEFIGDSHDWLCLKAILPTDDHTEGTMQAIQQSYSVWVGHADIKKVKQSKGAGAGGKLTVSFMLRDNSPDFPSVFYQEASEVKFNVEVLRKTEVDRRTESFIKMLPKVEGSLAADIALNLPICDLDKHRKEIASVTEHDLYFEYSTLDPRRRPLPRNNIKQQEAIDKALTARFSLIQGPPGSGKTYTGIKLIYLFNKTNEFLQKEGHAKKQVLFCGPSNKSVDLVAKWMLNRLGEYCPNFVRVYGRSIEAIDFPIPGRTFQSKRSTRSQEAPKALYPVALHHLIRRDGRKNAKQIKELDQMFRNNEYKPMPLQVKKYVHLVREASIDEIRKYDVILCTTAVGSNPKVLQATSVHQVVVDEAGMCTEPQCLVPIIATKAEQVVLIGDHKQLKPIIMCKEAALLGLETSLFERYANSNVAFTMLNEQYRMNPNICKFPSQEFYEDSLITKPGLWRSKRMEIWPKMDDTVYPHVFVHVEGEEKILPVSTEDGNEHSRSNLEEIEHVVNVYAYLDGMKQPHESVQILSQYNAQCAEIKRKLKEKHFQISEESVSTVVSSQGGEWDYVIFSTVRSLPEYKIEKRPTLGWCKRNLGFITDRNQINVAITRARKGLVIIGNTKLLVCDSVWKNLILHYEKRGCIKTKEQFPPQMTRFSQLLKT